MGEATSARRIVRALADGVFYAALVAFLYGAAAANVSNLDPPLNGDTSRDFLLATQCLHGETCLLKGARTTASHLHHSGLWVLHLAATRWAELSVPEVYQLTLWLFVAASVLLVLFQEVLLGGSWGLRRWRAALVAAVMARLGVSSDLSDMFAAIVTPLPAAILLVATVTAVQVRSAAAWLLAALAFSVVVQGHAAGGLFAPALGWLFLRYPPRRPVGVALVGVGIVVASVLLLSRDAALDWPRALASFGRGGGTGAAMSYTQAGFEPSSFLALAGGSALAFVLGARLLGTLGPAAWALVVVGALPALALGGAGALTWFSPHYAKPYLLPLRLVAALAVVQACQLLARGLRWALARRERSRGIEGGLALAGVLVAAGLAWQVVGRGHRGLDVGSFLTYGDLEAVLPSLEREGIRSLEDVFTRLRGPERLNLASNLHLALPRYRPEGEPGARGAGPLLLWKDPAPPALALPSGWTRLDRPGRAALFLAPGAGVIDWQRVTVTCDPGGGREVRTWVGSFDLQGCEASATCEGSVWLSPPLPTWITCRELRFEVELAPRGEEPVALLPFLGGGSGGRAAEGRVDGLAAGLRPGGGALLAANQAGRKGTARIVWSFPRPLDLSLPQLAQVFEVVQAADVDPAWIDRLEALR